MTKKTNDNITKTQRPVLAKSKLESWNLFERKKKKNSAKTFEFDVRQCMQINVVSR